MCWVLDYVDSLRLPQKDLSHLMQFFERTFGETIIMIFRLLVKKRNLGEGSVLGSL